MEEKMNALAELLEKEPEFADQLMTMGAEEAIAALNAKGVAVTAEEMAEIAKTIPSCDEELAEDTLDDVAGGGLTSVAAGYIFGRLISKIFR